MQSEKESIHANELELSDTWQALLGGHPLNVGRLAALKDAVPTLESDPWSALLHDKGVEMVDLQQLHLHMSDHDVEQALQMMQEQAPQQSE